jgi:hypothetical protein
MFGLRVQRGPTTLVQNTGTDLFTVTGGKVVITGIIGEVTTLIANTASLAIRLQHTPSGGSAADLSGATVVTADAVGTLYSLTSGVATDLLSVQSVSAIGGTPVAASEIPNVTFTHLLWRSIVVRAGTVRVLVSNHDPGSGAVKWTMLYAPLDDGAVAAAA